MATELLDRHVLEGRGARPALHVVGRGTVSYAALQAWANRAGNMLKAAGVEPEQRVALLLPDGLEFVATFLGAMKIGAVPVPLNTAAPPEDLVYFVHDSRARALVSTPETAEPLHAALDRGDPELQLLKAVFLSSPDDAVREHGRVRRFWPAVEAASAELATFPTGTDEPSYWLYSSGTTGRPKGTVHLHGDMLACVTPYAEEVVDIGPNDVLFSVARLFFSYGLVNSLYLPLLAGASVVLLAERPDVASVLDVVRRYRPTLFFSVPTNINQLCTALDAGGENHDRPFDAVRYAVAAGETLPPPVFERWLRITGGEILDGLGSTEVGYIYCSAMPGAVRPGSSGQPIGGHALRLVDEHGQNVTASDEPGELWVRAASSALHYWNQREKSKSTFDGEWVRTGDRYARDQDGYYWNLGRTDDVFKVSGQWVSPLDVESCLLQHPAVAECAVVGLDGGQGLMTTAAYVVIRPEHRVEATELQAFVKSRLLPHKYPRQVHFVDALPRTATGKVQRYKLRQSGAEAAPPA